MTSMTQDIHDTHKAATHQPILYLSPFYSPQVQWVTVSLRPAHKHLNYHQAVGCLATMKQFPAFKL